MEKEDKDDKDDTLDKKVAAELVARTLNMAVYAHMEHLTTSSFADHKALEALYEDLPEVADNYAEHLQGMFGKFSKFPSLSPVLRPMRNMISDFITWIDANEDVLTDGDTTIENDLAEIRAVLLRAKYRLNTLS